MLGAATVDSTTSRAETVVLPAPPPMPEDDSAATPWTAALPMLGGLGSVAMMAGVTGPGQAGRAWLVGGLLLLSSCAMVAVQLVRQRAHRTRRLHDQRRSYLHGVAETRPRVRAAAVRQRDAAWAAAPDVATVLGGARPASAPVERFRVGVGPTRLDLSLRVTDPPSGVVIDPVCAQAAQRFVTTHEQLEDMPVTVPVGTHVLLDGDPGRCLTTARALVAQAAGTHDPASLAVGVLTGRAHRVDWDWVKWLPHAAAEAGAPEGTDALGPRRTVTDDAHELARLLGPGRQRLLVVDGAPVPPWANETGTTVLVLRTAYAPADAATVLDVDEARLHRAGTSSPCRPDTCDPTTAETVARRIAARATGTGDDSPRSARSFLSLVGAESPDVLPAAHRSARQRLVAPLGHAPDGAPVVLDLKEASEGGHGPHGLVIGATGSGKSELLRTLVLGLVATHGPDELATVLVDFKGGATFAELEHLPHVAGFVTNLADDLALVDRMQDALAGELTRRQELLRASGHTSLAEHRAARAAGEPLEAIPSLFVCVDEFTELLTARPELIDLFVAFGRLGRSLGVHLLLATQRLEEGRLRGLESHLSYRVALRTFSASESRAVIGVPDAHTLPPGPGAGLLRTGPDELVRFDTAYVSAPWQETAGEAPATAQVLPFTVLPVGRPPAPAPVARTTPAAPETRTLLERLAAAADRGTRTHQVWQPPLTEPVPLGALTDDLVDEPRLGLHSPAARAAGGLVPVVGLVDRPRLQRRDPLVLDLRGAGGHVAVVGGPRSGRSTALLTYVTALALGSTPLEAQVHLLDLAGGALAPVARLPHVVGHARRGEDNLVRRVVDEVCEVVDRRERLFSELGVTSLEEFRDRVRDGRCEGPADVHLVVDGWGLLRTEHEESEARLVRLAARALTFGVHLVVATQRWNDLRPTLRDLVGSRVELRLTDAYDSEVDRRVAGLVPADQPGRGLVAGPEHVRVALPDPGLVDRIVQAWRGPRPVRLAPLPDVVPLSTLRAAPAEEGLLPLALAERGHRPLLVDPGATPHVVVRGGEGSGRTQALRTYLASLLADRPAERAQVVLLDPRRQLADVVGDEHLLAYADTPEEAAPLLREVATLLGRRTRLDAATGAPEVFVVADDADLLTDEHGVQPLDALVPLLPRARDVGLRVVVARRQRASHVLADRVDRALDDLGTGLLTLTGPVPGRATWRRTTAGDAKEVVVQVAHALE